MATGCTPLVLYDACPAPAGSSSRCSIKRHRFHSKTRNSPLEVEPATFTTHFSRLRNHTAAVTYLELWIQVCFSVLFVFGFRYDTAGHPSKYWVLVSSCDRELWPVALAFKFDPNKVKINQHAICLAKISFSSKIIVQTQRQTDKQSIDCSTWTTKVVGNNWDRLKSTKKVKDNDKDWLMAYPREI